MDIKNQTILIELKLLRAMLNLNHNNEISMKNQSLWNDKLNINFQLINIAKTLNHFDLSFYEMIDYSLKVVGIEEKPVNNYLEYISMDIILNSFYVLFSDIMSEFNKTYNVKVNLKLASPLTHDSIFHLCLDNEQESILEFNFLYDLFNYEIKGELENLYNHDMIDLNEHFLFEISKFINEFKITHLN